MKPIDESFLNDCADITERYDKLQGSWDLDSQLLHIITEIAELKNVMRNKKDKFGKTLSKEWYDNFYDELADVHLTVFATDNFLNKLYFKDEKIDLSNEKLNEAIMKKLLIVKQRVTEAEKQ
jgi:hypothetical protein